MHPLSHHPTCSPNVQHRMATPGAVRRRASSISTNNRRCHGRNLGPPLALPTAPEEAETSGPHPAVATCASTACSSAARSATDSDATPRGDRQLDAVHACTRVRCRRGSRAPRHMVATDLSLATPSAAATAAQVPTSAPARAAVGTATASAPATAKVMTAASAGCRCACRKSHRQRHQLRRVGDVGHVACQHWRSTRRRQLDGGG